MPAFYVHNCILMPLSIAIHHKNMLRILSCAFELEFESEFKLKLRFNFSSQSNSTGLVWAHVYVYVCVCLGQGTSYSFVKWISHYNVHRHNKYLWVHAVDLQSQLKYVPNLLIYARAYFFLSLSSALAFCLFWSIS